MTLNEYLQQADHAYAELIAERKDDPDGDKAEKQLQRNRIFDAVCQLIPVPLRELVAIDWQTMTVQIRFGRDFSVPDDDASYVEAHFTANNWLIEITTYWRIYLNGQEAGDECELIHAIGALRHELSKRDEEASAA